MKNALSKNWFDIVVPEELRDICAATDGAYIAMKQNRCRNSRCFALCGI